MKFYAVFLVLALCVLLVSAKANGGKRKDREGKKGGRDRGQTDGGEALAEVGGTNGRKGGKGDRHDRRRPGKNGRPNEQDGHVVDSPCEAMQCGKPTRETRVCGTDGKTYKSECHLIKDQCKGKIPEDIQVASTGSCAEPSEGKRPGRKPGKGGKRPGGKRGERGHGKGRWPKECWDVLATAEPDTVGVEGDVCTAACPVNSPDYPALPVCGTDGLTYPSSCVLELAACITENVDLTVASEGACQ